MPQFEAVHAQVVGVSADVYQTLSEFAKKNNIHHPLLADLRRQMLPKYDAVVTDPNHPLFRYPKRAYFILDKTGTVKFTKVMDNPTTILSADEVLKAIKDSGAA
jgi:peroxiredoxin